MNKILFNYILGIIVTANMLFFPVQAEEVPVSDAQTAVENLHNEERSDDPGEESAIGNDSAAASENEMNDEGGSSDETENEAGTGDVTEEEETAESAVEETGGGEKKEEENQPEDPTAGVTEMISDDPEDPSAGVTEVLPDDPEDPSAGVTEVRSDDPEDPSAGMTEMLPGDPEGLPDPQTIANDPGVDEKPENAGIAAPAKVYARPVINSVSTDGTSITLEWDNEEGVLFRIYRWNLFPYVIGTSTTGSFVDTDVFYGRSYTYFIEAVSSAYRYPYSQTVSKWVRRPIGDIDEAHRIGEDLAWDLDGDKDRNSLVISGNGSMPDFSSVSEIPWHGRSGEIRHISIDDGVTYVGDRSFSDMEALQEVSLPSSVPEYGHEVFRGSTNLEFFNHDSAVDGEQLHIAVQYLMGVYSGGTFEPEVHVRKGPGGEDFDGMPALMQGRDYTVTYSNTTKAGDGTIEITFIGDYADAGSVVVPFCVVSELRPGEKIKSVTGIELLPSSSIYTGAAQRPEMIVRSGRWILKEGVDYILTCSDMVDAGTYTVTAQGIGAYSGKAQAFYTILNKEHSEDPRKPVEPSAPSKTQDPDPTDSASQEAVKTPDQFNTENQSNTENRFNTEKTETEEAQAKTVEESEKQEMTEAVAEPEKRKTEEAAAEPEKKKTAETAEETEKKSDSSPSGSESHVGDDMFGRGELLSGDSRGGKNLENVKFFAGVVGIVMSICIGVYIWFFHWFLHEM